MLRNVIKIHITKETAVIKEAQKFQRNKSNITRVIISSVVRIELRVEIASFIRLVLS